MAVELIDQRLIAALQEGRSVITSQHTQARYLRYAYAHHQKAQGTDAWMTPRILTWNDWVLSLAREVMWSGYKSSSGQRSLLNPSQEQLVWEQILSQSSGGNLMDNLSSTAAVARQAWGLIQAWRLPDPKTAQFPNSDVRAFSGWMKRYFETSSKNHWLDSARLPDSISPAIRAGAITPPDEVILFGFDKFSPQQRVLLKTLENLGSGFKLLKQKKIKGKLTRAGFANFELELVAAARWARMQLAQDNPGVTAILVPDLDQRFDQVKRIFDEVLSPGSALPSSSLAGRPYTLSTDRKFSRNKLVLGAQTILRHVLQESFFAEVSTFLRSPFTRAAGAEQPMRARFELWLRQHNIDTVRPGELESLLDLYAQRHDADAANSVFHALLRGLKPLGAKGQGRHP
ncbi:MAG: hypothetical protein HKN70_13445, partial [Gammaproteobacteria bacterium]|nr:hypothetical protein [Gammaproteobacteria bacterium]